jgi:hypothetical protein
MASVAGVVFRWMRTFIAGDWTSNNSVQGRPRGEVPDTGPFPRDPPPNRTCPVKGIRLSSDYSVSFAAGCPVWMSS